MTFQNYEPGDRHHSSDESQLAQQTPKNQTKPAQKEQKSRDWLGVKDKTLWNYLELLIVPLLLLVVTSGMGQYQKSVDDAKATQEKSVAIDRKQQETLNSYIDTMTDLMKSGLNGKQSQQNFNLAAIATARTILTFKELSGERNMIALGFLKESNLIRLEPELMEQEEQNYQEQRREYNECLSEKGKKPKDCSLPDPLSPRSISLEKANLAKVNFHDSDLNRLELSGANLSGADLTNTILIKTNLQDTNLTGAKLEGANLTRANLKGARVQENTLKNVKYCHTIMPNGIEKNDDCSFIPNSGDRYTVIVGNDSGTRADQWGVDVYRDPKRQEDDTPLWVPSGSAITLTGEYYYSDNDSEKETWVKIKDEGSIGGWIQTEFLVKAAAAN